MAGVSAPSGLVMFSWRGSFHRSTRHDGVRGLGAYLYVDRSVQEAVLKQQTQFKYVSNPAFGRSLEMVVMTLMDCR